MIKRNIENIKKVLEVIENNPETWDQSSWHCGTSHCFAGHAQILAGKEINDETCRRDARTFFGFTGFEADYFFYSYRTLEELKTSLDPNSLRNYDLYSLDEEGYDRYGYDEDGLDIDNNPI
jgi:hypothetical protein